MIGVDVIPEIRGRSDARSTHLDRHTRTVHPDREEGTLAQHPLVPCVELDLGYGEAMAKVERAVHVRVGEGPEPFGVRFTLGRRRCVYFEEVFVPPSLLIFLLETDEEVAFVCLWTRFSFSQSLRGTGWTCLDELDGTFGCHLTDGTARGREEGRPRRSSEKTSECKNGDLTLIIIYD